jgi:hypothetical protein
MPSIEAQAEYYKDKLQERGFVSVPFEITGADIDPLFGQFRDFLDLCDEPGGEQFREALADKPDDRSRGGDYFVVRRRLGEVNPHAVNQAPATENQRRGSHWPAKS